MTEPALALAQEAIDAEATMRKADGENFPVASRLLPASAREHLLALYGFARAVDDIGDLATGDRLARLDWVQAELGRALAGEPCDEVIARAARSVRALGCPREALDRLIEANRRDQVVMRYGRFEDLLAYCDLSANPVGLVVLYAFGETSENARARSDEICSALQVIEHLQDLREDYEVGRIYLPTEDLATFGVEEASLGERVASPALRRLVAFECARARELLEAGAPLVQMVRGRLALALAGFVGGGLAQLDAIEAARFDVLAAPVKASKFAVGRASLRVLVSGGRRR